MKTTEPIESVLILLFLFLKGKGDLLWQKKFAENA